MLEQSLRQSFQGDILFDRFSRGRYSTDASIYQMMPAGVVAPRTREDVEAALYAARMAGV